MGTASKQNGRPSGLMLHRGAFEAVSQLTRHQKSGVATAADLSAGYISDLLAHRCGASRVVADRIAGVLGVPTYVLFPELDGWISPLPDRNARRPKSEAAA